MNTVPRQDGTKEKRAEFTLSRLHAVGAAPAGMQAAPSTPRAQPAPQAATPRPAASQPPAPEPAAQWNSAPLVPDTDDIPF